MGRQRLHAHQVQTTSTWRTDCGSIDVLSDIPSSAGKPVVYKELRRRAALVPTGELRVPLASLDDIIASNGPREPGRGP